MKKIALTILTIVVFGAYLIHQKTDTEAVNIIAPKNSQQNIIPSVPNPSSQTPSAVSSTPVQTGIYKDGMYTGDVTDAFYGPYQVQAIIFGGKITDVKFLQTPNDRGTSIEINSQASPYLKQEAISAQTANVQIVSGATDSSNAFIQSLASALAKAK